MARREYRLMRESERRLIEMRGGRLRRRGGDGREASVGEERLVWDWRGEEEGDDER